MRIREQLQGQVSTPEIFGWTEDEGQVFIYMSLIEGETLQERWSGMDDAKRRAVCEQLKIYCENMEGLNAGQARLLYRFGKQPLSEAFGDSHPELAGPFQGVNAIQLFHDACGIEIDSEVPIVFTHSDFFLPDILLSLGSNPQVAAIIDWGQAGWYPAYWEYCKARRVRVDPEYFGDTIQEEWHMKYLPMISWIL
ncbi:uncharacterized protein N7446_010057 [Penicillium canescens]|uniref:uncharacterized protein n=1 Tax=Penicillium canescens TaxID=5083 RepID=UPI0026DEDA60|nr:uncharacterized protein N7446_010057 [Penicillium canescens]KAJ6037426.1 hypothetical protein N7444_010131 [Penicillium canescens]KAJ6054045.1 hypothetical protein N7446_010057 [Penicillium canescens]